MATQVWNNVDKNQFEIWIDGKHAGLLSYSFDDNIYALSHTEVFDKFGGEGAGTTLVLGALDKIRAEDAQVLPYCPFIPPVIAKNAEFTDLVPETERARFGLSGSSTEGN